MPKVYLQMPLPDLFIQCLLWTQVLRVLLASTHLLPNGWIDSNCGSSAGHSRSDHSMERMENSMHDLISALQSNAQVQKHRSPFRAIPSASGEPETDEDDDTGARPTAAGTDESEERKLPL
jgi:hypothetical protein